MLANRLISGSLPYQALSGLIIAARQRSGQKSGQNGDPVILTDTACRESKPGPRPRKLNDGHGLWLEISPAGTKAWSFRYQFALKERRLGIGRYPAVTLKAARKARDDALVMLSQGIDPAAVKRDRKRQQTPDRDDTFEKVARAWHAARAKGMTPRYAAHVLSRLERNVFPKLGRTPIRDISAIDVLEVLRAIEKRGALVMARRVRQHMSAVFVWAIAEMLTDHDPAAHVVKAMQPVTSQRYPAHGRITEARTSMAAIDAASGAWWATRLASRFLAITAARPGTVRMAERHEFEGLDSARPIWRIPAAKMKQTAARKNDTRNEFIVPLPPQAVELVRAALRLSPSPTLLFPGTRGWKRPISDATLSKLYLENGLRDVLVPHGWRATFSTIMNERAALAGRDGDRAVIDLMLAHTSSSVEAAYNRAAFMPRRREIAEEWADLLLEGALPLEDLLPR